MLGGRQNNSQGQAAGGSSRAGCTPAAPRQAHPGTAALAMHKSREPMHQIAASTTHSAACNTPPESAKLPQASLPPHCSQELASRPVTQALLQLYSSGCVLSSRWKVCDREGVEGGCNGQPPGLKAGTV